MEKISMVYEQAKKFDKGMFRKQSIPMECVQGWPAVRKLGNTICLMIPYYRRRILEQKGSARAELYPIYCSVTFPIGNPNHLYDFTIYRLQKDWKDVEFGKPIGCFDSAKITYAKDSEEYRKLCIELYKHYDGFIDAVKENVGFDEEERMSTLISQLIEPELYPYYERMNKGFYSHFYKTGK